ncbi:MAG: 50S ribosomal protein L29 [Marinilabiliales bacterium]|nr:MAG: 50S ribosomal protein L29 [Marinilabiliales bacterium]
MKSSVIKEMTTDELKERLEEEQKQLSKLRMNHTVSPLDNPVVISQSRKVIARIKTELRSRELETK